MSLIFSFCFFEGEKDELARAVVDAGVLAPLTAAVFAAPPAGADDLPSSAAAFLQSLTEFGTHMHTPLSHTSHNNITMIMWCWCLCRRA